MEPSTSEGQIVATTKFKPSFSSVAARRKKEQDDVVDDWDAESSDEEAVAMRQESAVDTNSTQADVFRASKDQWAEANSQAPAALPVVVPGAGRSLPGSAFGQRLSGHSGRESNSMASSGYAGASAVSEPPRILQRPKNAAPGLRSDGTSANMSNSASQVRKTVEQRQEEYRLARERIFGTPANGGAASSKDRSAKP